MLNGVVKYFKRSGIFSGIYSKFFIEKTIKSDTPFNFRKYKVMYFLSIPFIAVYSVLAFCRNIFKINYSVSETNSIAEYSIYKRYARYKLLVFFVAALLIMLTAKSSGKSGGIIHKDYIARISIEGIITDEEGGYGSAKFYEEVIKKIIDDKNARGAVIYINSGGGSVGASEILYNNLLKLSQSKPTYCNIGSAGASGAYMAAIACKKIYAKNTSIIGSIGVRRDGYEISEVAKKVGVNFNILDAGKLKSAGHPWKQMTSEERDYLSSLLQKMHSFFIAIVAKERNMDVSKVEALADGSVMPGFEAKDVGLVDEIGDEDDIVNAIALQEGLSPDISVVDIKASEESSCFNVKKMVTSATQAVLSTFLNYSLSSKNSISLT